MSKAWLLLFLIVCSFVTSFALLNLTLEFIMPALYRLNLPPGFLGNQEVIPVPENPFSSSETLTQVYEVSPYVAPIAWGLFGALVWKGKIRGIWSKKGYDYDEFKVVSRMRGSPKRVEILEKLFLPKTRLQIAKELGLDWKTVDNHVKKLINYGFVEEAVYIGTSRYLIITERGKEILSLLEQSQT